MNAVSEPARRRGSERGRGAMIERLVAFQNRIAPIRTWA